MTGANGSACVGGLDDKKLDKFKSWLAERGAQLMAPTNPYEVVRFVTKAETCVLYRNAKSTNWKGSAATVAAVQAFLTGAPWRAAPAGKRNKTSAKVRTLVERDGDRCFYCDEAMPEDDRTIEHLLSVTHAGSNHIDNLVLAHGDCNSAAGNISVIAKVRMRETRIFGASA